MNVNPLGLNPLLAAAAAAAECHYPSWRSADQRQTVIGRGRGYPTRSLNELYDHKSSFSRPTRPTHPTPLRTKVNGRRSVKKDE